MPDFNSFRECPPIPHKNYFDTLLNTVSICILVVLVFLKLDIKLFSE